MKKKIKTYNIMLSKVFPVTHQRKGEPTFFSQKVQAAKFPTVYPDETPKLHTIRANYPLWQERIAKYVLVKQKSAFVSGLANHIAVRP